MNTLVVCKFPSSERTYDYKTDGSDNELAGKKFAIVTARNRQLIIDVVDIRPIGEKVFPFELKSVDGLYETEEEAMKALAEGVPNGNVKL